MHRKYAIKKIKINDSIKSIATN